MNPAAPAVIFTVAKAQLSDTTLVNVFPMIGLGTLVPDWMTGTALVPIKGKGTGTLRAKAIGFDQLSITVDTLNSLTSGDLYSGLVYRQLNAGGTRPLANIFVAVM